MKKFLVPALLVITVSALALSACAARTGTATSSSSSSSAADQELSQAAQLLVGTLKLEGTDQAVDAAEAANLLPLWQAYSLLTTSDMAAQAEIEAVVAQIQATMTKEQVQAITVMQLTSQDEAALMSTLGLVSSNGTSGTGSTPQAFTFNGNSGGFTGGGGEPPAGGGAPGGVVVSGGGVFDGGGIPGTGSSGASATQSATQLADRTANSARISPVLLNALTELLQKRAGS